jgi:hypothetical protein
VTEPASAPGVGTARLPFAAKYVHRGWGFGLAIFGGLSVIVGFSEIGAALRHEPEANPVGTILMGLVMVAIGVYLLRGRGVNPAKAQRVVVAQQRHAVLVAQSVEQASSALAAAAPGGQALVAYRNLESTVQRFYKENAPARFEYELQQIEFDKSTIASPRFGYVASLASGAVEIFRDWVVFGQEAHNIDATTRGTVFTDGSVQVTSTVVLDKKSRQQVVSQQHDLRTAQLQLTSATWSLSTPIDPDKVNEARVLLAQLATHIEGLAGKPVTTADIREMVDGILNNTGQPAAERIRQLDVLRYERLVSNDEFKQAKDKILGL